jgi:glycosyltransferase involved in cell wall biosynthesis
MKKILHIISQKPGNTGSGIFLNSILEQADRTGYIQAVICGVSNKKELDFPNPLHKIEPVFFETANLPFPVVGMSDAMPYPSSRYQELTELMFSQWQQAFKKAILKTWETFQPDVILCHHLWLLAAFVRYLLPNAFLCVVSHGTGLRQMKLAPKFADYVKIGCQQADLVFALNDFQLEQISQVYYINKEKIKVIGSGYNSNLFFSVPKIEIHSIKTIVYVGKLAFAKGVYSLLHAIDKIDFMLELICIGSGSCEEADKIRELAQKSKQKISFTGAISQKQIAHILQQADAFVLPSFYEGLPLVMIEALACGLPVICTDLPGIREWLGDILLQTGLIELVSLPRLERIDIPFPDDIPAFEERLQVAITNQLNRFHSSADSDTIKQEISNYSWENIFLKMQKAINEMKRTE